jgi:hypothetical protein
MPSVITPCGGGGGGSSAAIGARVRDTFDEGIANATQVAVPFDQVYFNTDTMFSVSQPTRLTIKTAGVWSLVANVLFAANTAGVRQASIAKNGLWATNHFIALNVFQATTIVGIPTGLNVVGVYQLAVGDYVEFLLFQNSGGSLAALSRDDYGTTLSAVLLGTT